MKILQTVQKFVLHLGINAHQAIQKNLLNRRNVWALFVFSLSTTSSLIYLSRNAKTFAEYTFAVAAFSSMLVATILFAIIIWKMPELFKCLDLMEKTGDERKRELLLHIFLVEFNSKLWHSTVFVFNFRIEKSSIQRTL